MGMAKQFEPRPPAFVQAQAIARAMDSWFSEGRPVVAVDDLVGRFDPLGVMPLAFRHALRCLMGASRRDHELSSQVRGQGGGSLAFMDAVNRFDRPTKNIKLKHTDFTNKNTFEYFKNTFMNKIKYT
jgi:hypothetical protein